ncbi:MAG: hypothetical protein PHE29_06985 [Tissierellia bacterium]|nr:hypothetical protein [Tissierellia bacterium]MDD4780752.1 hypothetical protein [Tissierellia bacterium]
MALNYLDEYSYLINEYIEISDFDTLCNTFLNIPYVDKYMLSVFVAYIEGHITVDLDTKSWYLIISNKYLVLNKNVESPYVFINLYNYIKSNKVFFDFIIKHFNLWHGKRNPCFEYDNYHKSDLKNNLIKMVCFIKDEMNVLKLDENNKKYLNMFYSLLDFVFA